MKAETKKTIHRNAGFIVYALVIIGTIIISNLNLISLDTSKLVITLMALFILVEVFRQATQHESPETRKKIQKFIMILTVILLILSILGLLVFS
ncbi:MAG: hypothetical protein ACE5GD_02465 [Candidatus Geothermarchaeales archaeon]